MADHDKDLLQAIFDSFPEESEKLASDGYAIDRVIADKIREVSTTKEAQDASESKKKDEGKDEEWESSSSTDEEPEEKESKGEGSIEGEAEKSVKEKKREASAAAKEAAARAFSYLKEKVAHDLLHEKTARAKAAAANEYLMENWLGRVQAAAYADETAKLAALEIHGIPIELYVSKYAQGVPGAVAGGAPAASPGMAQAAPAQAAPAEAEPAPVEMIAQAIMQLTPEERQRVVALLQTGQGQPAAGQGRNPAAQIMG